MINFINFVILFLCSHVFQSKTFVGPTPFFKKLFGPPPRNIQFKTVTHPLIQPASHPPPPTRSPINTKWPLSKSNEYCYLCSCDHHHGTQTYSHTNMTPLYFCRWPWDYRCWNHRSIRLCLHGMIMRENVLKYALFICYLLFCKQYFLYVLLFNSKS